MVATTIRGSHRRTNRNTVRTGAEAGPATERAAGPQVAVHDARADELQEEVERVLELVVHPRLPQRAVHRPRQGRVDVRVQEKPVRHHHDRPVSQ